MLPLSQVTSHKKTTKVSFDPRFHTFTIMGTTKPHVVTLFTKETCSCPSTSICYHIMAAKLSIGQDDDVTKRKKINLSQLRKNARSRKEKTSGRKRPEDVDVVPASDAHGKYKACNI